jgi:hypothetical protein
MLLMTGIDPEKAEGNHHIIVSDDRKAAVWAGVIDDLWEIGKPTGEGGPWKNSEVTKGVPSDPYLIGFYDKRKLTITHNSSEPVSFVIEADPAGNGTWMKFIETNVNPGETFEYSFPEDFQARWVRFVSSKDCMATAWLKYE